MLANAIKTTILEVSHFIWHMYNCLVFGLVCIYYSYLSNEQQTNLILTSCDGLRIPKHIAMAFTNEMNDLDLDSIARLLCWCKQLGIEQITLYDDLGKLKNHQKQLLKSFDQQMKSIGSLKHTIEGLNIISRHDGRQKFLDDVKSILKEFETAQIDLDLVQRSVGWTCDPELLISFGLPLCLHGFPPWQLRLTEILSIPTHKRVPKKVFLDCLIRFSKISQRVGT